MPAFYRASLRDFLATSESELTGKLTIEYARGGFTSLRTSQTIAWRDDILRLRNELGVFVQEAPHAIGWTILLEFPIPRKEKRIDVVLLTNETIVILELKSSAKGTDSLRQAGEYALLLHYFHQPSDRRKIIALVVAPNRRKLRDWGQQFLPIPEAPAYWISTVEQITWKDLPHHLNRIVEDETASTLDAELWDNGEYRPVPTIIEAALALRAGLDDVREIASSKAARHDVNQLTELVNRLIEQAKGDHSFAICFLTGVPGSGKTLVGLNLSFSSKPGQDSIHFMSGNGPLVSVLQAALAANDQERNKVRAEEAKRKAKTLIENVHVFAKCYTDENPDSAPSNHVIIFDEAQRAWDKKQNLFKFKRNYSEPEMLLKIMERHEDWAVVIALVGGGQEINNGEAGLQEWGRALAAAAKPWQVFASPEALDGGTSVAGTQLFAAAADHTLRVHREPELHLSVSVRSLKAKSYAAWVNEVISGNAVAAATIRPQVDFPIIVTRSLDRLRELLYRNSIGLSRPGLVASSGAARLRAEGIEPSTTFHKGYPWHHWYLAEPTDVRSSHRLEVSATEFEIQGLEVDWTGLCWGGDFIWSPSRKDWIARALRHKKQSAWSPIKDEAAKSYRRNAYRVLLTRARCGVVIYVPQGDVQDPTRNPAEFDHTAEFLQSCGAQLVTGPDRPSADAPIQSALFP